MHKERDAIESAVSTFEVLALGEVMNIDTIHMLVDDLREIPNMDVIVRDSRLAIGIFVMSQPTHLYLDNDMGIGRPEGWEILRAILVNPRRLQAVKILSSNRTARDRMIGMLELNGYFRDINHEGYMYKKA